MPFFYVERVFHIFHGARCGKMKVGQFSSKFGPENGDLKGINGGSWRGKNWGWNGAKNIKIGWKLVELVGLKEKAQICRELAQPGVTWANRGVTVKAPGFRGNWGVWRLFEDNWWRGRDSRFFGVFWTFFGGFFMEFWFPLWWLQNRI